MKLEPVGSNLLTDWIKLADDSCEDMSGVFLGAMVSNTVGAILGSWILDVMVMMIHDPRA